MTTVVGHHDLLRGGRIPPFPMTPGLSNAQKAVVLKNS